MNVSYEVTLSIGFIENNIIISPDREVDVRIHLFQLDQVEFKEAVCHRFIKITDRTLDVVFSRFLSFFAQNNLDAEVLRSYVVGVEQDREIACSMPTTCNSSGLLT